jgi:hypothetical protein
VENCREARAQPRFSPRHDFDSLASARSSPAGALVTVAHQTGECAVEIYLDGRSAACFV